MPTAEFQAGPTRILYDPDALLAVSLEWLQPQFWQIRKAILEELGGRGQALKIETAIGIAVLRRYLRGGQVARFSRDRYLFTGYQRSRAFREWRVIEQLHGQGLPVPRPLAASCERRGLFYRAGLMTRYIDSTLPLSQLAGVLTDADWQQLATTLAAFFQAGLIHVDLNAGNILRDGQGRWYLIDFDRARLQAKPADPSPMLARLARSLDKLQPGRYADYLARLSWN
jgi:3-deoxy-D-manno-octulosonic acid kinase